VAGTLIVPVVDEGLGNSAYLVDLGDGRALAVDVPRDLRAVRAAADRHGLKIAFAADTHLHADFLSGARQLAAEDGAQILGSAAGHRAFDHRGLADGDEVDLGGLTLRAWATPGHTAEHLTYLLLDGAQVLGVFTGGRCWSARRPAPTCPARSRPRRWPGHSTPPWAACSPCPMRRRFTRRTVRGRSAPPRPARNAPPPSGGRRPPTRCWQPAMRTPSSRRCWPAWAPSPATSCGCPRRTGAAPLSCPPPPRSPR
jgi:hypothetical protein